jgi:hypothetical protein
MTKAMPWKLSRRPSLLLFGLVILPAAASLSASSSKTGVNGSGGNTNLAHNAQSVTSLHKRNGQTLTYNFPDYLPNHPDDESNALSNKQQQQKKRQSLGIFRSLRSAIRSTFLPSGYPRQTPPNYLSYCAWSWTQDLTTQLRAVLATQRVLEGVGVGRPGATALSALLNFLCRDGCGMLASLLFTSVAASRFRANVKEWRLFADVMIDVGITLEVLAVQLPTEWFLPMISVGNMCKAVCGVTAGACGGAINVHWAKGGSDISEIQAKFQAQNTVAGSLGLVCSALFAKYASHVQLHYLWLLYGGLTAVHIFANMQCMRLLAFTTFNTMRLKLVAADFLTKAAVDAYSEQTLSPAQITLKEPLFFFHKPMVPTAILPPNIPIYFGVSFTEYSSRSGLTPDELRLQLRSRPPYFVAIGTTNKRQTKPCILVAVSATATDQDQIKAYFHAMLLTEALASGLRRGDITLADPNDRRRLEMETVTRLDGNLWKEFQTKCSRAGWDLTSHQLQSRGFEVLVPE